MEQRLPRLREILGSVRPAVVAFSGGVDSTFLLLVASEVLGPDVTAVTAVSPSLAALERDEAIALARRIGVSHRLVETHEMEEDGYRRNDGRRCYFCKRELFRVLGALQPGGGHTLLYGAIPDDLGDDRPGMLAAAEAGVRAPLLEAGLTKKMIRDLARQAGLPNWNKPAMPCLASRIPRMTPVTTEALGQVERAEAALRELGYRQVRVRFHGTTARVEIGGEDLARALHDPFHAPVVAAVRGAGFSEVVVDPLGYRSAVSIVKGPAHTT
jgi:uncharacterized protein